MQVTKPPIATAVQPPAANAAKTGATNAPELETNIGDLYFVTIKQIIVDNPAPTNAPDTATPQIFAINTVATKTERTN